MKRALQFLLALFALLLLIIAGGALWLALGDLKSSVERLASDALGRRVVADRFIVTWGDPLHLELEGLRVANAEWGSTPEIITLKRFSADVDVTSLWQGVPRYRHLRANGLHVVLERDKQGIGNWKFGGGDAGDGGFALIPKNRRQFPTLLDFVLNDALITYRTYSGNVLRIRLDNVAIAAPDETSDASLKAAGAYNNMPLGLDAKTASFRDLRDAGKPFRADLALFGKTSRLALAGTLMEPLDFDGVAGDLRFNVEELDNLLAGFGLETSAPYPLSLNAYLTRQGDHWELTDASGKLESSVLRGQVTVDEGSRGAPDRIKANLAIDRLMLDRLLPSSGNSDAPLSLTPPRDPGAQIEGQARVGSVRFRNVELKDVDLAARLGDQMIAVDRLRFPYAGGRVQLQLEAKETLRAQANLDGLDAGTLAQMAGAPAGDIGGRINGRMSIEMPTGDVQRALAQGSGAAILTMTEGHIRRALIEKMSTDLRAIFRTKEGSAPIRCLGGILLLKNGIATVAPLRLRAQGAVVEGGGTIDFVQKRVDLTAKSNRKSTGFFALDLPIGISGPFDNLGAGLAADSEKKWAPPRGPKLEALDPAIRKLAAANPCLG